MNDLRLGILLHHHDKSFRKRESLIFYMAQCWKRMNFEVIVLNGIPKSNPDLDLLIPHIDRSVIPEDYIQFTDQYPHVLNREIVDISKRKISTNLLDIDSNYKGSVIVKSNLNYGGLPESRWKSLKRRISLTGYRIFKTEGFLSLNPAYYRVYNSNSEVPERIRKNQDWVVERFIPERESGYYCIRVCHFLGKIMLNNKVYSRQKIIKGSNIIKIKSSDVHPGLLHYREQTGFDYGKLDYVIHKGVFQILDANKTPGTTGSIELSFNIAKKLSKGIQSYL